MRSEGTVTAPCGLQGRVRSSGVLMVVSALIVGVFAFAAPTGARARRPLPSAPTGVRATPGDGTALVSWLAATTAPGEVITAYQVKTSAGRGCSTEGTTLSCTVSHLVNGGTDTVEVRAMAHHRKGTFSTPVTVIPGLPGAPTDVYAAPGAGQATVSFSPAIANGSIITDYEVTADAQNGAGGGQTAVGPSSPITVTGLTNGDSYSFTVTATNLTGTGVSSLPSESVVPFGSSTLFATGSSFAGVAIQEWVGQTNAPDGPNIDWQVSSSVIGLNNFAQNQVDFAASDIPYSSLQSTYFPTQPYQYLPDVASGLAFMFNLNGTNGQPITNLVLNASLIAKIFLGEIVNWNDPAIAAANPQLAGDLPNQPIIPVYRSDASGENYLLSDYLLHQDASVFTAAQNAFDSGNPGQPTALWPAPAQGSNPSPTTYPGWGSGNLVGESGSDNAANFVAAASSVGAITYVETAYAKEHSVPVASLVNASGAGVQPTSANVATALDAATLNPDLTQNLADVYTNPQPGAYPLSAYSYLVTPCAPALANAQGTSCDGPGTTSPFPAVKGQALGQFVAFLACAGQEHMSELGYSPLPVTLVEDDFAAIGRMNGAVQPPTPTPTNCPNPNVGAG